GLVPGMSPRSRARSPRGPPTGELHHLPSMRPRDTDEMPAGAAETPPEAIGRRGFLRILGATTALAGIGCDRGPAQKIIPYAKTPEGLVPGEPLHYATVLPRHGFGVGVVVTAREGRPIKVEGNERHPSSLGAAGPLEQAEIASLYDARRART